VGVKVSAAGEAAEADMSSDSEDEEWDVRQTCQRLAMADRLRRVCDALRSWWNDSSSTGSARKALSAFSHLIGAASTPHSGSCVLASWIAFQQ
jgi:hypothetical protein